MRASIFLGELHGAARAAAKNRGVSLSKFLGKAVEAGLESNPKEVFASITNGLGPPKASAELTPAVRTRARRFAARGGNLQQIAIHGLRQLLREGGKS